MLLRVKLQIEATTRIFNAGRSPPSNGQSREFNQLMIEGVNDGRDRCCKFNPPRKPFDRGREVQQLHAEFGRAPVR